MSKEDFIEFIKELGFTQTWGSNSNSFSLSTDVIGKPNQNYMAFADQLKISIDNGYYDDIQFINVLEKKLNNINYQKFNYFKKQLEVVDITNELINNPDYMKPEFKIFLDLNKSTVFSKFFSSTNQLKSS